MKTYDQRSSTCELALEEGLFETAFDDPLLDEPAADEAAEQSGPARRPRILLVEDGREEREVLALALESRFQVEAVEDGEKALALLENGPEIDLIITDLLMPVMGGDKLLSRVREIPRLKRVPVIVVTAHDAPEVKVEVLERGAQDLITKPFRLPEVMARVTNLVRSKRAWDVLSEELADHRADIETLARRLAKERRRLVEALEVARVARQVAEKALSTKDNFLRMVTHELRTPLTAMQLQIQLMDRMPQLQGDPAFQAGSERLMRASRQIQHWVDAVLEIARFNEGKLTMKPAAVVLDEVVSEVMGDFVQQAHEKSLELGQVRCAREPMWLEPRLTRLVVSNLVANAVKYTREGSVTVTTSRDERGAVVTVEDTGPGIPPAAHRQVFGPFERLGDRCDNGRGGLGLGLAIVKDLVEAMRGKISLSSDGKRGTRFEVSLPELRPEPKWEPSQAGTPA